MAAVCLLIGKTKTNLHKDYSKINLGYHRCKMDTWCQFRSKNFGVGTSLNVVMIQITWFYLLKYATVYFIYFNVYFINPPSSCKQMQFHSFKSCKNQNRQSGLLESLDKS